MPARYSLSPDATLTQFDGRSVVFSKKTGDFFGLNDSAKLMLEELLGSDLDATVRKSAALYGVDEGTIRTDLQELVAELARLKLIETML